MMFSCDKAEEPFPTEPVPINLTAEQIKLIDSENSFAFDIFNHVLNSSEETENILISPLSISIALSMTLNGAEGDTRNAIIEALRLQGITPDEINTSYKSLAKDLLSVDKRVLISIANSVWTEDEFPVRQEFIDILKNYYDAESRSFDIDDPSTPDIINSWIEEKTNRLIKNMISELDDNTVMLLINAIYFKGKWKNQFDASKTTDGLFKRADNTSVDVPMMKQTENFKAYRGNGFVIAELPYGQGNYVMNVLIPDNGKNLNALIPELNDANFSSWVSNMSSMKTDITFPRFKYEYKKELTDILSDMGMGIAFTENADFSQICGLYDLLISFIKHQAFIETNEEGTEAAAATVVGFELTSAPDFLVLNLDRPFIYIIRETTTNSIVFMGRLSDPSVN
ncbi:MAG: serpin family protein [Bacteroidales bacterium]|nr:serpin family protein [Bacteroidales bacterium]